MASYRLALLAIPMLAALAAPARADEPPPPPMYPPGQAVPVYPAPLSQTTQSTYVPQSVALSGPEEIRDFDDSRPVPAGYTMVERTRRHLIVGGGVTFGVSYGIALFGAAIGEDSRGSGKNDLAAMWVPVIGPFMQMADTDSATGKLFLAGLGGAQAAGAILLYYGLTTKNRVLVRNDLVGSMSVGPLAVRGAQGVSLAGRF
jgi:hypothetical protein